MGEGRGESQLEMAGAHKAKTVSWPPDVILCQVVTLFLVHAVLVRFVASLMYSVAIRNRENKGS